MAAPRRISCSILCIALLNSTACAHVGRVQLGYKVATPGAVDVRMFLAAKDSDLPALVHETAATARSRLRTDEVLSVLRKHRNSLDYAKWGVTGLAGATTVLGTVGSNQEPKKTAFVYGTAVLGALTTFFTAIRDDKDISARIAACETVAENGNDVVDSYEAYWIVRVQNAPATGDPKREAFINELAEAGRQTVSTAAKLMTRCY